MKSLKVFETFKNNPTLFLRFPARVACRAPQKAVWVMYSNPRREKCKSFSSYTLELLLKTIGVSRFLCREFLEYSEIASKKMFHRFARKSVGLNNSLTRTIITYLWKLVV